MKPSILSTSLCTLAITAALLSACAPGASTSASTSAGYGDSTESTTTDSTNTSCSSSHTDTMSSGIDGVPSDSLLLFGGDEGAKRLLTDAQLGKLPTSCTVLYDQMGSLPTVTVTDPMVTAELIDLVAQIRVGDKSDVSVTDSYHFVDFTLEDGTEVGFRFEGEGLLSTDDGNYEVSGDGALWDRVRELQHEWLDNGGEHAVTVVEGDEFVEDCPTSAAEGETVRITTYTVTDVRLCLTVTGASVKQQNDVWEFVMPDHDVSVSAWVEDIPGGGA